MIAESKIGLRPATSAALPHAGARHCGIVFQLSCYLRNMKITDGSHEKICTSNPAIAARTPNFGDDRGKGYRNDSLIQRLQNINSS